MKKLMIGAIAAFVGIAANAASVAWEACDVYEYSPTTTEAMTDSYLVYFIDNAAYDNSAALNDIANDTATFIANVKANGQIGTYDGEGYAMGQVLGYSNGEWVTAYAVVFNSGTSIDDATYAYISATDRKQIGAEGQEPTLSFDTTDTQSGANWTTVAAPEPTSGLLLLLGVAGLALKRRRA